MEAVSVCWCLPCHYMNYKRDSLKEKLTLRDKFFQGAHGEQHSLLASVNRCNYLNKVFSQPSLLRKQTVHETEMQWPSLLSSSNFSAAASRTPPSDQCWTSPTAGTRTAQHMWSCSLCSGELINRGSLCSFTERCQAVAQLSAGLQGSTPGTSN